MGGAESKPVSSIFDELAGVDIAEDDPRWAAFVQHAAPSALDLYQQLPLASVRAVRQQNPRNFARLVRKVSLLFRLD